MTRERHVALWSQDPWLAKQAHRNFDRFADTDRPGQIDADLVRADLRALDRAADGVKHHVDETIAHAADQTTRVTPTYEDLNEAIDKIGDLVRKYTSLLEATVFGTLEPIIQSDWEAPFRVPWIRPRADAPS